MKELPMDGKSNSYKYDGRQDIEQSQSISAQNTP